LIQVLSCICEAVRLALIQILLQRQGLKLNPVSTLYYMAPACLACLGVMFVLFEYDPVVPAKIAEIGLSVFAANAACAFALNLSVFLLIGKTSALTMNLSGIVKDWFLIFISSKIFNNPITSIELVGYGIAFAGLTFYNREKLGCTSAPAAVAQMK